MNLTLKLIKTMKNLLPLPNIRYILAFSSIAAWKKLCASKTVNYSIVLLLSLSILASLNRAAKAQTPENAPQELIETIAEIEEAANKKDLEDLLDYYSKNFTNTDGLTHTSLSEALKQIWQNYPQLRYSTRIESWEQVGEELIANTVTSIRGTQRNKGRIVSLNSTLRSRQHFQDKKLVRQEILSEQTQITSGMKPPKVNVIAPEQVSVGQKYNFDVIVTEPLENSVLLGAAIEERTGSDRYLTPSTLELEPLPAGGIYKIVTAPRLADSHWLSAIVVRGDGITMVTKRVNIGQNK